MDLTPTLAIAKKEISIWVDNINLRPPKGSLSMYMRPVRMSLVRDWLELRECIMYGAAPTPTACHQAVTCQVDRYHRRYHRNGTSSRGEATWFHVHLMPWPMFDGEGADFFFCITPLERKVENSAEHDYVSECPKRDISYIRFLSVGMVYMI